MESEDLIARFVWWVVSRLGVGSWLVMIAAGTIHNEVHPGFPSWSWTQSFDVAFALTVFGFFFRDLGQGFHKS